MAITNLSQYYQSIGKPLPSSSTGRFADPAFAAAAQQAGVTPQTYAVNAGNADINNKILQNLLNHPNVQQAIQSNPALANGVQNLVNNTDPKVQEMASKAYQMIGDGTYNKDQYTSVYGDQYNQLDPYFKENQKYAQGGIQDQLGLNNRNYNRYTQNATTQFGNDKQALDTNAAKEGVLFSTSRRQDQTGLQNKYASDLAAKRDALTTQNAGLLRDYQYKYGNDAVQPLNSYTKIAGAPSFNANVANGGVKFGSLSRYYNPNSSANNFYGTNNTLQQTYAGSNTSDYLRNLQNKSNLAGYKTN